MIDPFSVLDWGVNRTQAIDRDKHSLFFIQSRVELSAFNVSFLSMFDV